MSKAEQEEIISFSRAGSVADFSELEMQARNLLPLIIKHKFDSDGNFDCENIIPAEFFDKRTTIERNYVDLIFGKLDVSLDELDPLSRARLIVYAFERARGHHTDLCGLPYGSKHFLDYRQWLAEDLQKLVYNTDHSVDPLFVHSIDQYDPKVQPALDALHVSLLFLSDVEAPKFESYFPWVGSNSNQIKIHNDVLVVSTELIMMARFRGASNDFYGREIAEMMTSDEQRLKLFVDQVDNDLVDLRRKVNSFYLQALVAGDNTPEQLTIEYNKAEMVLLIREYLTLDPFVK